MLSIFIPNRAKRQKSGSLFQGSLVSFCTPQASKAASGRLTLTFFGPSLRTGPRLNMTQGHTVFLVEFVNRQGNRSSKKKSVIIGRTKAGHKWTRNVTGWTEENTVDKDIKQIEAKQTEHNDQWVEMISGSNTAEFAPNPFE